MPIYTVQPDRVATGVLRSLRRRFFTALALLALCIAMFTLGFFVLDLVGHREGTWARRGFDALWNTLNLVSTVGSLSTDLTLLERGWALLTIVIGLGAVLYGFGSLQALFHGDVARLIERHRMQRTLQEFENHIVVCGYGRVGRAAAAELIARELVQGFGVWAGERRLAPLAGKVRKNRDSRHAP